MPVIELCLFCFFTLSSLILIHAVLCGAFSDIHVISIYGLTAGVHSHLDCLNKPYSPFPNSLSFAFECLSADSFVCLSHRLAFISLLYIAPLIKAELSSVLEKAKRK